MPSSYTLGDHYETFVRELVDSGRYVSASEVIRDALRLLEDAEKLRAMHLEELRAKIQEGIDSGDAGIFDKDEIIAEAKRLKATRRNAA